MSENIKVHELLCDAKRADLRTYRVTVPCCNKTVEMRWQQILRWRRGAVYFCKSCNGQRGSVLAREIKEKKLKASDAMQDARGIASFTQLMYEVNHARISKA